jgi:hypothetical protein
MKPTGCCLGASAFFVSLPMDAFDKLVLQVKLRDIGRMDDATATVGRP